MKKDDKKDPTMDDTPENTTMPEDESEEYAPDTDFDLEEEYKPTPLIPNGNYRGNVIGVEIDPQHHAIVWKVALADNGGTMSDGQTPIDGVHQYYRNFLPKRGDETERTKDGRQTKRQVKVNMMKDFANKMNVNMNDYKVIAESITNQDWIGLAVIVSISISTFEGVTRNQIDKMTAAPA